MAKYILTADTKKEILANDELIKVLCQFRAIRPISLYQAIFQNFGWLTNIETLEIISKHLEKPIHTLLHSVTNIDKLIQA